ncbi:hypothetical protein TNCV_3176451 [Trichonephila clavipes]|nr:hypothetical protein TNCV_3176451 [Trichonephila clavipes]
MKIKRKGSQNKRKRTPSFPSFNGPIPAGYIAPEKDQWLLPVTIRANNHGRISPELVLGDHFLTYSSTMNASGTTFHEGQGLLCPTQYTRPWTLRCLSRCPDQVVSLKRSGGQQPPSKERLERVGGNSRVHSDGWGHLRIKTHLDQQKGTFSSTCGLTRHRGGTKKGEGRPLFLGAMKVLLDSCLVCTRLVCGKEESFFQQWTDISQVRNKD